MRGNVYRLARRRVGPIVLATSAALAFALGGTSTAAARPRDRGPAKAPAVAAKKAPGRTGRGHAKVEIRSTVLARAAGHKIA